MNRWRPPTQVEESPVQWGQAYDKLTEEQKKHTWFTDGSAKYVSGRRKWKSVAFNPALDKTLVVEGEGKSSQYAELYAVFLALKQEQGGECHLYTDSWSVANGLATWITGWKKQDWKIHGKELWGKEIWQDIDAFLVNTVVTVFHVDAHVPLDSLERLFNSQADAAAAISLSQVEQISDKDKESWLQGTAIWAHQKSGHLGEKATHRWANEREALQIINNRPITESLTPLMRMLTPNLVVSTKMHQDAQPPYRGSPAAAGLDLYALEAIVIAPGQIKMIPTGIGCKIPEGHYGQLATRSSFALKGAVVIGGVIDSDYQGEIKILMINLGPNPLIIAKGERAAQMLLIPIYLSELREGEAPTELTVRGDKGSTNTVNVGAKIWVQNVQGPPSLLK
ncbi:deoxyuridine 5 -triphosphate nucleotidohydrolase-like [Pelobates cultripes]|uniref:Deoxyuridine 5'-triphosphate nucleotidohydrolase n=1 Tax=Pelobates cultripes TaxID=61616 RepID=A0AAD1R5V9_PELCU|nr:deoxyuridine 5 -triphosphate nucleotidohydrolase-like [Pelobates cultripes]